MFGIKTKGYCRSASYDISNCLTYVLLYVSFLRHIKLFNLLMCLLLWLINIALSVFLIDDKKLWTALKLSEYNFSCFT